ncbi:MAG: hypothetical protein IJ662_01385 [Clostridia bacterium]|nr:hypothetical protein [Clostridia bacterium]
MVKASWSIIGKNGIRASSSEVTIKKDSSVAAPSITVASNSGARNTLLDVTWKSSKNCVKVKGSKLMGSSIGTSKLTAQASGMTLKVNAKVVSKKTKEPVTEIIEDYETPLGLGEEFTILLEADECLNLWASVKAN